MVSEFSSRAMPFGLQAVTLRIAAVSRIERAEETNEGHGAVGELIARIPFAMIGARRDAEAVGVVALAVGQQAVEFGIIIRMHPGAVVVIRFAAVKQIARTELLRDAEHAALIAIHAAFHRDEVLRQRLVKHQMGRSGRTVIAHVRVIRAFLVIQPLHEFRDDGVHVGVTLAMRVRRQIERHVVEENGEVRAVIEIEAAQEILVRLSAAGVLRDDDAGNGFQNFARAQNGTFLNLCRAHRSLCGRIGDANQAILSACDDRFRQTHRQRRVGVGDRGFHHSVRSFLGRISRSVCCLLSHGGTSNQAGQQEGYQSGCRQTKSMQQKSCHDESQAKSKHAR